MMNAKRMHYLLLGLLVLAILGLLGGAYGINSLLAGQSKKLAGLKQQSQTLEQEQLGLKKAKKDIATYAELEKITRQVVPQDKDQAEAVREIVNIASGAGVSLSNISFPASTLGSTGAAPITGTGTTAPVATGKPALSQLTAVPNIPGVYQLPITLQDNADIPVSFDKLYNFLSQLENNRRTAIVNTLTIQPLTSNRNLLTFTLTLNEYIKP